MMTMNIKSDKAYFNTSCSSKYNFTLIMKTVRRSNLELYRIIVMLLIVSHHYVVNSGLLDIMSDDMQNALSSGNQIRGGKCLFFYLLGAWGKTGINCFVLITGYFMCKSNITLRKFLKLILQVYFYNIVIGAVFALTGYHSLGIKEAVKLLWPLKGINDNFTSCYLMFFLCIPFLNAMIHNISKRQHQLLVMLLLFGFSIVAFPPLTYNVKINYVTWFSVLYIVASYLRLYPLRQESNVRLWSTLTLSFIILGILSVIYRLYKGSTFPYDYISDSNQILSLAIAVSSFMLFKNLSIPQSKLINTIASTTFGVLLIHANSDAMRQWLWKDIIDCVGHYADIHYILYSVIAVLCIFIVCSLIDWLRIKIVEERLINSAEKIIYIITSIVQKR